MEKERSVPLPAGCPEHSRMVERVAILEKGMETVEKGITGACKRLEILGENITNGILQRYPAVVVWIISILTGVCTALITALFMTI